MKTKDKEIIIEGIKESILQYTYGNNTIEFAAKEILDYVNDNKANEKELLKKCFEAGGKHELKPLTTDLIYEQCPDFETWYNQLKNQKENG